jgi:Fur family ferric uptake transcriptional regulator
MNEQNKTLGAALVRNGFRLTTSRQAIIDSLVRSGGHISADDLADRVRAAAPRVGRMTVYRTLDLLAELGLIRAIYQGTGAAHYVLLHGGSHHHLICNRCGLVIEFEHCTSEAIARDLSEQFQFQIQSHLLEFHGLCDACRNIYQP